MKAFLRGSTGHLSKSSHRRDDCPLFLLVEKAGKPKHALSAFDGGMMHSFHLASLCCSRVILLTYVPSALAYIIQRIFLLCKDPVDNVKSFIYIKWHEW